MHKIGIVIATKKREHLLDTMLASLMPALEGVDYEIKVVVGDKRNRLFDVLDKYGIKDWWDEESCLGSEKHSWGTLYNFGFKKCDSKWIMYCSDDIVFDNLNCFRESLEELEKQPDSVAGGSFFYRAIPSDILFEQYGVDYTYGHKLMINYGLIRSSTFWEVGGIEETFYKFYCADGDLCFKLFESGKSLILLPKCLVTHRKCHDATSNYHMSRSNQDIGNYKKRWKRFLDISTSLNPRRLYIKDLERLERIKKGIQVKDNDSRRFIHMEKQIAWGLASADVENVKEIWL